MERDVVKDALLGIAVGDALGVPVEFLSRAALREKPVMGMRAFGSHQQPAGTWSDDSSLCFCLAEMLCEGYDIDKLGRMFVNWQSHGWWTPHGEVFDIGIATSRAINRLADGVAPLLAGGDAESSNGNGSLMRILPLVFLFKGMTIDERFGMVAEVSSLTHRHIRSILGCFIYLEVAYLILEGKSAMDAYREGCERVLSFLKKEAVAPEDEVRLYDRVLSGRIGDLSEQEIYSTGYVIHTLEAAIWCLLNTTTYADSVLKAVNLGDDSDTTGAVTGGLSGLLYGWQKIPIEWLETLVRRADIEALALRLSKKYI